jgi:two-component system, OmpR family, alkaline phosphatase synthesis response regulator PhoP
MARIEALLRRSRAASSQTAAQLERFGDIEVDAATRSVRRGGADVGLTPMEFDLLLGLLRRQGAVVSRIQLLAEVWGHSATVLTRTVDTHIGELRRKLETDPSNPRHILTVRKAGYRLAR